ncbi:terpenoid cyclases/protein prenyltransferase alpha-alpha toroid [Spinellus fusiger]|nr:terpenoid cyclases/protein prenyltransferase alpha-alpha toroid [Spinellus fusiger]
MSIFKGIPLAQLRYQDDLFPTDTSIAQKGTEESVVQCFAAYAQKNSSGQPLSEVRLNKKKHISYLSKGLDRLGYWMVSLDASKPWIVYWILHSLDLLQESVSLETGQRAVQTISKWQLASGGFGGGPDQLAHLATTYAAINSLAIIGTQEAYDVIDRETLYAFLLKMKQPNGSFTMHNNGEIDIRGSYCALSVAAFTNLLTPELTENCIEFIASAQTYEGGVGPYPGKEAHNGYTYCGIAAMEILGGVSRLNLDKLINWCSSRQMALEGGFQGRTNKLVDGCYSFWGAGGFPILKKSLAQSTVNEEVFDMDYLFDREALQEYLLLCCQSEYGGCIDKPGKGPDYYHTCYGLSGLSTAQHTLLYNNTAVQEFSKHGLDASKGGLSSLMWTFSNDFTVVGDIENLIAPTHPVHNVSLYKTRLMLNYFYKSELEGVLKLLPKDDEPWEASLA